MDEKNYWESSRFDASMPSLVKVEPSWVRELREQGAQVVLIWNGAGWHAVLIAEDCEFASAIDALKL